MIAPNIIRTTLLSVLLLATSVLTTTLVAQESDYRLSSDIEPLSQLITLKLDPDNPEFSGHTQISINVTKGVKNIGFYQSNLKIEEAVLVNGDVRKPLLVKAGSNDISYANLEQDIAANEYVLDIRFSGKINTTSDGVYLSKFEGNNYLFTQFEDMLARKAFPSFDEPSNKIPYQITIEAPEKHTVLSNTPVEKRSVSQGWQTVKFKTTKPMPTYILAFSVGEFDSVEITGLSVPGRIYTPKGQAHRTKFAVKHTPRILAKLENYFGRSYPYEKLDFVAVPNFTHGAMENAGLVTYRSGLLLLEDEPRLAEQARPLSVIAHELAHMWYGNLVTMAWWDDLWLNEAFASWMASKVMLDLYPEQNYKARLVAENAFGQDAAPTTRPIKKPVRTSADVFDGLGLNYSKGEAILQLMESMVGEKEFQTAVRAYMKKHQWSNATADDLWANLSDVASFDVPSLMQTYLEQPSYPLVSITEGGTVTQSRYRLSGAKVDEQTWVVPLSVRYSKNGKVTSKTFFVSDKVTQLKELDGVDWLYPNADAKGYLRWQISANQLQSLLSNLDALSGREKKSLLYNYKALLDSGDTTLVQMMTILEQLAKESDPMVGRAVASVVGEFEYLVNSGNKVAFAKFIDELMLPWFERLGVVDAADDSDDIIRLRSSSFGLLAAHSTNKTLRELALAQSNNYLNDPLSVSNAIGLRAMQGVAKNAKPGWFSKFEKAYAKTNDANVQGMIRFAMQFSDQGEVVKALDFALTDAVGPADVSSILRVATGALEKHDVLYQWLDKNVDKAIAKMPEFHTVRLPILTSSSCSQHNIDLAKAFYKDRVGQHEGMQRTFKIAISNSEQCLALKQKYQNDFDSYLASLSG